MVISPLSVRPVCCILALAALSSCNRPKSEGSAPAAAAAPEASAALVATGPAPLPAATLAEIGKSIALIQIPGSNDVPGVLLAGGPASRGRHSYLILGAVPANLEQAVVAYASDTGVQTWSAKRRATLPSGVAIFGFTSKSALSVHEPSPAVAGETFHGLQLRGEGSLPDTEQASLTTELESLSAQVKTSQEALNEARRMQMAPNMMGGNPQRGRPDLAAMEARRAAIEAERTSQRDEARATGALAARQAELSARLKFPVLSVTPVEVATGVTIEALEQKAGYLNHALLATSAGKVRAIRRQQQWLNVDDLIASVPHDVQQVKLSVSGNRSSARVTCEITPAIFDGQTGYSLVAATTFALETQGSGTLEQRLAGVTPVPFQGRGAIQTAQTEAAWNANKTTLWIKVFSDQEPDKPVIDEAILLDYPESFSARWAKPPSPLIVKPTPTPDSPADLVRGSQVLDAKGEIRDLVAAGDGSVVVVRTAAAPFWAALDLKSGEWLKVPWTATEDTLVAAQAGKIYLIDRRTHIVDIRELADGKRVGMQLLPVDGMVTAVAAPLSATDRPLLVATDKELVFIDPTAFERVPSGLNAESIFAGADARNYHYEPLVPASICLRASQDGSTYTISGTAARNPGRGVATLRVTLDPTAMVAAVNSEQRILPTRGRNLGRNLPDHAGSGLFLTASGNGGNFPNAPGKISIGDESSSELAVLNNPPLIPPRPDRPGDVLPPDRGAYFDSAAGVILFPDGANLHLVRLNFTAPAASPPEYVFAGEVVEIPLPPGSGHQFTSSIGGATEISAESARWTVPENASSNSARLRLDWTGELGSRIGKDYQVQVMKKEAPWVAESSDGSRQLVLHRRLVLPQIRSGSPKFAGSGHVLLMDDSDCGAWNLVTGEKLFSRDDFRGKLMGDADRIYLRDGGGKLTSYDIATGRQLGEMNLDTKISGLCTGMASRLPLLAVEMEGARPFLLEIRRDTLQTVITDFPEETQQRFFAADFYANASGSAAWSRNTMVLRDRNAITVKPGAEGFHDGTPDASGRFVVSSSEIIDLRATPPKPVKVSSFAGMSDSTVCRLDAAGRYILLCNQGQDTPNGVASVRSLDDPAKELFKLRYSSRNGGGPQFWFVSSSASLICPLAGNSQSMTGVLDFDIDSLAKQLAR